MNINEKIYPLQTSTEAANAAGKSPDGVRGNGARAMPDDNFPPRKSLEANNFRGFFFVRARRRERFGIGLQPVQFDELVEFLVIRDMDD